MKHWILSLASIVVLVTSAPAGAQDWPMARRDSQRIAFQPLGVAITRPGELARIDLGGPPTGRAFWVADADGDGAGEAYVVTGGRVAAYDPLGTLRWVSAPLGLTEIVGMMDLDGDGRTEVLASALRVAPMIFDALSGVVRSTLPIGDGQAVGDVFPLAVGGSRAMFVSEFGGPNGGHATGRIVSFPDGLGGTPTVLELDTSAHGYWYGLGSTVADVDGDGQVELVVLSSDAAVAYDVLTGAPKYRTPSLGEFPHGIARLHGADVDGDGRDEVVCLSNNPATGGAAAKRLILLEFEGGTFSARWEYRADATLSDHRFVRESTATLRAGEGRAIVSTILDAVSGHYQTLVWSGSSSSNAPLATIDQRVVLALADIDGDGTSEIITQDASDDYVSPLGDIRALHLQADGSFVELAHEANASLALAPVPFMAGSTTAIGQPPLVLKDEDLDGTPDAIAALGGGGSTFRAVLHDPLVEVRPQGDAHTWFSQSQGQLGVLDRDGRVLNDTLSDGELDLVVATLLAPVLAVTHDATGALLATVDEAGRPLVYDGRTLEMLWIGVQPVAGPKPALTWRSLAGSPTLMFVQRESTGRLAFVGRGGRDGAVMVRVPLGDSTSAIPLHDPVPLLRRDGTMVGLVVGTLDQRTGQVRYRRVNPADASSLDLDLSRGLVGGEYPVTANDQDGDGTEDAYVVQVARLRVASGADGHQLSSQTQPRYGGMYSFVDLDGDAGLDAFHGGGFGQSAGQPGFGARRLNSDLSSVTWSFDQMELCNAPGFATGAFVGAHLALTKRRSTEFSVVDASGTMVGHGVPAGGTLYADAAAAEAAGAVQGELSAMIGLAGNAGDALFLGGSTDGYLYALRASDAGLSWSLPLRVKVGEPIAADALGLGTSQVLVATGDGSIRVIGQAVLATPDTVFDNDGDALAGSAAADLDELHVSDLVGADWPEAIGASGYETSLLREDGFVVVPWVDVGGSLSVRYEGLSLEAGVRYHSVVRAYDRTRSPTAVSGEVTSDGFLVVDDAPPTAELTAVPPLFFRSGEGAPNETLLTLVARDAVSLASYRVRIERPDGVTVRLLGDGPAAGRERRVELVWDGRNDDDRLQPVGRFEAVAVVADGEGRMAEARAVVVLCGAGAPPGLECQEAPDGGVWDAGVDAGSDEGRLAGGGGCGCRIAGRPNPEGGALLLFGLAALLWRRR